VPRRSEIMKPMVRPASKRGAGEMSVADQLDAAPGEPGTARPELPPEHSAATSRDKTG
jgi:hypothetical protein